MCVYIYIYIYIYVSGLQVRPFKVSGGSPRPPPEQTPGNRVKNLEGRPAGSTKITYIYIYLSISLSLSLYIYIYIYVYICRARAQEAEVLGSILTTSN